MRHVGTRIALVMCAALAGCSDDGKDAVPCASEPVVMTTSAGVEFARTPDSCFASLPDWSYEPRYVELDGLRQAYVDEGRADGPVVLLLHGQPSWSYLYRKMIPVLADAGCRVIAMDHLGMGRSDKPVDIASYSYLGHVDRLERFIQALGLEDITLFCQDWGSPIPPSRIRTRSTTSSRRPLPTSRPSSRRSTTRTANFWCRVMTTFSTG